MKYLKLIFSKIPNGFKNKRSVLFLAVILAIIFILFRGDANTDLIETSVVAKKDIKSELFSTGKIVSKSQAELNFAVFGRVEWIGVSEGEDVYRGQVLATLNRENLEAVVRQANQDVLAADAQLRKLHDAQRDKTVLSYDEQIDRTAVEALKNKAVDSLKIAERNLENALLTSPVKGKVISLNISVGDEVLVTETVAKVADVDDLDFLVEIDESDIGALKTGQKATIYLEAYPDEEISSTVSEIGYVGIITSTEATVFEVKFSLDSKDKYILGMNGDIQVVTDEKQDVLTVPVEALFEEDRVFIKRGNTFELVEVETGIENDSDMEIVSGLSDGDIVLTRGFEEIGKKNLIKKLLRL